MIKFVYGILPCFISYSDDIPIDSAGIASGIFIKIRPDYKDDDGLLEHELTHIKQFYTTFMLHGILYKNSKTYRLNSEIEAYKVQLEINKNDDKQDYTDFYVKRITEMYDLEITTFEVKDLLNRNR
jgi:hypothetical protein